jgi:hypothetical protein
MNIPFFLLIFIFSCIFVSLRPVQSFELGSPLLRPSSRSGLQRLQATASQPSHSDKLFIQASLVQNAQFSRLTQSSVTSLVENFEKCHYDDNELVVEQGDSCEGDYVYMVGADCEFAV